MSLAISASFENEHYIAVDTAVSIVVNGVSYRNTDQQMFEKLRVLDGEAYFFAGDRELCIDTYQLFEQQSDREFDTLLAIAKENYKKNADDGDRLAMMKYGFDDEGRATIQAMDDSNWDTQKPFLYYGDPKIAFMAYGAQMKEAIQELGKVKQGDPRSPYFYIPIFEAVANEGVGESIKLCHLTPEKWGMTSEIPLNERRTIRKLTLSGTPKIKSYNTFVGSGTEAFPVLMNGEGDGMRKFDSANPIDPSMAGENMSGRGFLSKPNGSYDMFYFSSNFGRVRSVRLRDDGITVVSEAGKFIAKSKDFNFLVDEGTYKIDLANGTVFEVSPTGVNMDVKGNIAIKATGVITMNGQRINLN